MKQKSFSRRQFLQIIGLSAAGVAAWQLGIKPRMAGLAEVSVSQVLMGTVVNLTVVGEDEAAAKTAVSATLNQMSQLESLLSRHRSDSELSRLNANGRLAQANQPLIALINQSRHLSDKSGGAFDISVKPLLDLYQDYQQRDQLPPETAVAKATSLVNYKNIQVNGNEVAFAQPGMGITLDGIGKGYIVDAGTAVLKQHGFVNVLVEAGGDLMAAGVKDAERPWRIGIQSPRPNTNMVQTRFSLSNQAAATSGDYMQAFTTDLRQHHIIDPRTGYSASDLASVTITAPTAMLADGLATAVMVLGEHSGLDLVEQWADCQALLVRKDMTVVASTMWG